MQEGISTRARIAILIYSMTNAVLFGIGIILVLNVPSLAAHAWIGIPVVVLLSLVLAVPVAWRIAPLRVPRRRSGRRQSRSASARVHHQSDFQRLVVVDHADRTAVSNAVCHQSTAAVLVRSWPHRERARTRRKRLITCSLSLISDHCWRCWSIRCWWNRTLACGHRRWHGPSHF